MKFIEVKVVTPSGNLIKQFINAASIVRVIDKDEDSAEIELDNSIRVGELEAPNSVEVYHSAKNIIKALDPKLITIPD